MPKELGSFRDEETANNNQGLKAVVNQPSNNAAMMDESGVPEEPHKMKRLLNQVPPRRPSKCHSRLMPDSLFVPYLY